MADQNTSNPEKNRDKAEGDRRTVEDTLGAGQDERNPEERYDGATASGGGITNRPLDEEIENQEALPERGQAKDDSGNLK